MKQVWLDARNRTASAATGTRDGVARGAPRMNKDQIPSQKEF
jgi:hypothetical protein